MKRIALINFTGFRGNWGCQATSFELLKFVAGLYPEDMPLAFDFVPLLPRSHVDQQYEPRLDEVYAAFTRVATGHDRDGAAVRFLEGIATARYAHWAKAVQAADLVVFQAEGSMGLGGGFAHGPRLMLLPFVAKHAWGKTVISLNQTFYAQDPRILQNAVETFGSFDFTAFREGASLSLARACGLTNACVVPDLAFMSHASTLPGGVQADGQRFFAVSGSALKDPDRYRLITQVSDLLTRETGLRPLLAVSRDLGLTLRNLARWRDRPATLPRSASYTQVTAALQRSAFLVGGRYHMSILAAAASTPNIFLPGNSFKNDGLTALIGQDKPVRQFRDFDGILEDARTILRNGEAERDALAARVSDLRAIIGRAQAHLKRLIGGEAPGRFEDGLPEFVLPEGLLASYERFGSGKHKNRKHVVPGARLGSAPSRTQVLRPMQEGLPGDDGTTAATLARLRF